MKIDRIVIATSNPGKLREFRSLLSESPVLLESLNSFEGINEVPETGSTFLANAQIKASAYAMQTGHYAMADDSGLEVAALNGEPGVYSARYGGEGISDAERIELLLEKLRGEQGPARSARFAAAIAFASPTGNLLFACEGQCPGMIAGQPFGEGGFGYDPVFIPDGFELTFGQLPESVKAGLSHRAKAARTFLRFLLDFTGV